MIAYLKIKGKYIVDCLLLGFWFATHGLYSFDDPGETRTHTIPNMLRRPDRGESPRLPRDLVIGELGRGEAPGDAYFLATNTLSAMIRGNRDAQIFQNSVITNSHFEAVADIRARNSRIGGGRIEADGSVSFLVRFIGPEETIIGELFLRQAEELEADTPGIWLVGDLILEEKRLLREVRDSYRFDFSPYERFF